MGGTSRIEPATVGGRFRIARWQSPNIGVALRCGVALLAVVSIGTVGFTIIEHDWTLWKSLYFTLITVTTVGYGDQGISPTGQKFASIVLIIGIATATYSFSTLVQLAVKYQFAWKSKMQRQINGIRDHIVICGYGRMGQTICARLAANNVPFVVIEQCDQAFQDAVDHGVLAIQGCATEDEVLHKAGVPRARGVVCVVNSDAENVFTTLSARHLNQDAFVVCRADSAGAVEKVERAGASLVVSPHYSAAMNVATEILRPHLAEFLRDSSLGEGGIELSDVVIQKGCLLEGQTVADFGTTEHELVFVAVKLVNGERIVRPRGDRVFASGDIVIVAGNPDALARMHKAAQSPSKKRQTAVLRA